MHAIDHQTRRQISQTNKIERKITMTTINILNKKIKEILGNRYSATNTNGFSFRYDNNKLTPSFVLNVINEKAGEESKKEIAKLCLLIAFGR